MNHLEQRISSREVAEMMEVEHKNLLQKIDEINKSFSKAENSAVTVNTEKYWIEGAYKSGTGRSYREFMVTKRGCEFLAHKSTGTKGNLFTDRYMDRFAAMEEQIAKPRPLTTPEQIKLLAQGNIELSERIDNVEQDLEDFKQELPLLGCDMDRITTAVHTMGVKCLGGKKSNAYADKSIRSKVYADIYDQLKRQFGVTTYK
ncbi:MAG: ORF6C domain-containing protein, partial [Clostridiales bacterium]|nr:ORF6C domain-containing protein [Clostridiales bacterium]